MHILILANSDVGLYKFRKELIEALLSLKHEVYISLPQGDFIKQLVEMGCHFIETNISRHGVNPITDLLLYMKYKSMLKEIKPDIVFTYTIKPNVYGGMACQTCKIPYLANVTGLGTAIQNGGILQKISMVLYKKGLKGAKHVFFQNSENHRFMTENGIVTSPTTILPGSGVNIEEYVYSDYPSEEDGIHFLFVGRIMKDKGIDEFLAAAKEIKGIYSNMVFDVVGGYDGPYESVIKKAQAEGLIQYHGSQDDVRPFYRACHCVVLPSYHEGMANVLLEGAAIGRPLITTNIPGCREVVQDGDNGFLCEVRNADSLYKTILKIIHVDHSARNNMGLQSRKLVEEKFDRQIIIEQYINTIVNI
jgi:galacturonosyltransferase